MAGLPTKKRVHEEALKALEAEYQSLLEKAEATRRGATHEESKAENDKDTRAIEAGYLARGQAARAEEMLEQLTRLRFVDLRDLEGRPIEISALVEVLDEDEAARVYFLVPVGGGTRFEVDGTSVQLLTPASPVGRALLGKEEGDDIELVVAKKKRFYEVAQVR